MSEQTEAVWKALSDPARRTILDLLRRGPRTTGALCEAFDMTRFGVMKHLRVLEGSNLIVVERKGRERWNYLNAVALKQATDRWLSPFQQTWAARLTALVDQFGEGVTSMSETSSLGLDVRYQVLLPATPERVFAGLTGGIDAWWGAPYRQGGKQSVMTLKPAIGEPLIETHPDGLVVLWARIEEIRSPYRLCLSGRFAVPGAIAGCVQYDLDEQDGQCLLRVAHTAVGDIDETVRANFTGGWADLLDIRLRKYLALNA